MISFICAIPQEPDDKAFMLSLYDSYYKLMYSIAYKYVSDILTVDDIVQDSIVSLYGKIDILKPMPDKVLAGYIVSTVRNTAINRLRVKEYEKDHIAEFTEENVSGADRYVPMETLLILAERRKALLDIWPVLPKETQILLKGKLRMSIMLHHIQQDVTVEGEIVEFRCVGQHGQGISFDRKVLGKCTVHQLARNAVGEKPRILVAERFQSVAALLGAFTESVKRLCIVLLRQFHGPPRKIGLAIRIGTDVHKGSNRLQMETSFGQPLLETRMILADGQSAAKRPTEPVIVETEHLPQGRFCHRNISWVQICNPAVFSHSRHTRSSDLIQFAVCPQGHAVAGGFLVLRLQLIVIFPTAMLTDPVHIQCRMAADGAGNNVEHTGAVLRCVFQLLFIVHEVPPS